jgi:cell division protein FtsQ
MHQDALASRRARMAVYQRFVAELDQNNQHLTEQVSEIDLSDPEDLRATMPEQGSDILAHFGEATSWSACRSTSRISPNGASAIPS